MFGNRKYGVTTQRAGTRYYTGFGYVALPKDLDRDKYINNCLRTNSITILFENGGWADNVPVAKGLFEHIEFPDDPEKLGSQVVYSSLNATGWLFITAVLPKNNEVVVTNELQFVKQRSGSNGVVSIVGDALKQFVNITVSSFKKGMGSFNLSVSNPDKTAELNVRVKGSKNSDIEGSENKEILGTKTTTVSDKYVINVSEDDTLTTITIEKDVGVIIEDQYDNKLELKKDGVFWNGGDNGGLINISDIVAQMNKNEKLTNNLLAALQGVVVPLAPSGTYPFAPLFSAYQPLAETQKDQIEDTKVNH